MRTVMEAQSGATLHGMIAARARTESELRAVGAPGREPLSYGGLDAQLRGMADFLGKAGIRRGDRVAVALPNGPELAVAMLGIATVATCVPLNLAFKEAELDALLSSLGVRALLASEDEAPAAVEVARRLGIEVLHQEALLEAPAGSLFSREVPDGAPALAGPD